MSTKPRKKVPCPINGCKALRDPMYVMCRQHWFKVTKTLRDRIWQLFKTEQGNDDHRMAIQAAIDEVEQQESFAQ